MSLIGLYLEAPIGRHAFLIF